MSIAILGRRPTGETKRTNCLACAVVGSPIPVDTVFYRDPEAPEKTRSCDAPRPFCVRCQAAYAVGRLPVHPYWFRQPTDARGR